MVVKSFRILGDDSLDTSPTVERSAHLDEGRASISFGRGAVTVLSIQRIGDKPAKWIRVLRLISTFLLTSWN
jgi:hypothetical protein